MVHHMFGGEVTEKVKTQYPLTDESVYYTAHFEVPGEMFTIASEAATQGRGVVGISNYIIHQYLRVTDYRLPIFLAKRSVIGNRYFSGFFCLISINLAFHGLKVDFFR